MQDLPLDARCQIAVVEVLEEIVFIAYVTKEAREPNTRMPTSIRKEDGKGAGADRGDVKRRSRAKKMNNGEQNDANIVVLPSGREENDDVEEVVPKEDLDYQVSTAETTFARGTTAASAHTRTPPTAVQVGVEEERLEEEMERHRLRNELFSNVAVNATEIVPVGEDIDDKPKSAAEGPGEGKSHKIVLAAVVVIIIVVVAGVVAAVVSRGEVKVDGVNLDEPIEDGGEDNHSEVGNSQQFDCFMSNQELRDAVDEYLATNVASYDVSSSATDTTPVAERYGSPISEWCLGENVTSLRSLFDVRRNPLAATFNEDVNDWSVSGITDMRNLLRGAAIFDRPLDKWQVDNVVDMTSTFQDASSFNSDISKWQVGNVESFRAMFYGATSFDKPLHGWNVSNAKYANGMFTGASAFRQDLCAWGNIGSASSSTEATFPQVDHMFVGTDCENQEDPVLGGSSPGPFCSNSCGGGDVAAPPDQIIPVLGSGSFCPPDSEQRATAVACYSTLTGIVSLVRSLGCSRNEVPTGALAALVIRGENSVLDCKGNLVHGIGFDVPESTLDPIYGIVAMDGATIVNCVVSYFDVGFGLFDGSNAVLDSFAGKNYFAGVHVGRLYDPRNFHNVRIANSKIASNFGTGIEVRDLNGTIDVVNAVVIGNWQDGILIHNPLADGNYVQVQTKSNIVLNLTKVDLYSNYQNGLNVVVGEASVLVSDVRSSHNHQSGMVLGGGSNIASESAIGSVNISLQNVELAYNYRHGIEILSDNIDTEFGSSSYVCNNNVDNGTNFDVWIGGDGVIGMDGTPAHIKGEVTCSTINDTTTSLECVPGCAAPSTVPAIRCFPQADGNDEAVDSMNDFANPCPEGHRGTLEVLECGQTIQGMYFLQRSLGCWIDNVLDLPQLHIAFQLGPDSILDGGGYLVAGIGFEGFGLTLVKTGVLVLPSSGSTLRNTVVGGFPINLVLAGESTVEDTFCYNDIGTGMGILNLSEPPFTAQLIRTMIVGGGLEPDLSDGIHSRQVGGTFNVSQTMIFGCLDEGFDYQGNDDDGIGGTTINLSDVNFYSNSQSGFEIDHESTVVISNTRSVGNGEAGVDDFRFPAVVKFKDNIDVSYNAWSGIAFDWSRVEFEGPNIHICNNNQSGEDYSDIDLNTLNAINATLAVVVEPVGCKSLRNDGDDDSLAIGNAVCDPGNCDPPGVASASVCVVAE